MQNQTLSRRDFGKGAVGFTGLALTSGFAGCARRGGDAAYKKAFYSAHVVYGIDLFGDLFEIFLNGGVIELGSAKKAYEVADGGLTAFDEIAKLLKDGLPVSGFDKARTIIVSAKSAIANGRRETVFVMSMGDIFEDNQPLSNNHDTKWETINDVSLMRAKAWNSFPRLPRKSSCATDHGASNPRFNILLRFAISPKKKKPRRRASGKLGSYGGVFCGYNLTYPTLSIGKGSCQKPYFLLRISEKVLNQPKKVVGGGAANGGKSQR